MLALLVREAGREREVGRLSDLADFLAGRESLGRNAGDDDGNDNSGDHVVSFACCLKSRWARLTINSPQRRKGYACGWGGGCNLWGQEAKMHDEHGLHSLHSD
jgi:hypothetical protein